MESKAEKNMAITLIRNQIVPSCRYRLEYYTDVVSSIVELSAPEMFAIYGFFSWCNQNQEKWLLLLVNAILTILVEIPLPFRFPLTGFADHIPTTQRHSSSVYLPKSGIFTFYWLFEWISNKQNNVNSYWLTFLWLLFGRSCWALCSDIINSSRSWATYN